jgi:hypothetical protein
MDLPDHIGKHIQNCLRPVEGFRIKAGQTFKNNDCVIKVYSIRWNSSRTVVFIQGARIFEGDDEDGGDWSINGGWGRGFLISIPTPKNKYCDMIYPYGNNKCFTGIDINKNNLL